MATFTGIILAPRIAGNIGAKRLSSVEEQGFAVGWPLPSFMAVWLSGIMRQVVFYGT